MLLVGKDDIAVLLFSPCDTRDAEPRIILSMLLDSWKERNNTLPFTNEYRERTLLPREALGDGERMILIESVIAAAAPVPSPTHFRPQSRHVLQRQHCLHHSMFRINYSSSILISIFLCSSLVLSK
jgi:hypothetical protein